MIYSCCSDGISKNLFRKVEYIVGVQSGKRHEIVDMEVGVPIDAAVEYNVESGHDKDNLA